MTSCEGALERCVAPDESAAIGHDYPSLAVDAEGRIMVSAYNRSGRDLVFGLWDEIEARFRFQRVDTVGDVGRYSALALDSEDRPSIVYFDATNNALKFASWEQEGGWLLETVDSTSSVGADCDLAIDPDDVAHVSYRDLTYRVLRYARRSEGIWRIEYVDTGADESLPAEQACPLEQRQKARLGLGYDSHIALQGASPVISYYDGDCGALRLARRSASSWSVQVLDGWDASLWTGPSSEPLTQVGRFNDLAVDLTGNLALAYHDAGAGKLKVLHFDAGLPVVEVADDGLRRDAPGVVSKTLVGQLPSLVFDGESKVVSHFDAASGRALLSTRDATGWRTAQVSSSIEGFEAELALLPSGERVVVSAQRIATLSAPIQLIRLVK
jgi:hypothetical protein